jgi:hypothetical protein
METTIVQIGNSKGIYIAFRNAEKTQAITQIAGKDKDVVSIKDN